MSINVQLYIIQRMDFKSEFITPARDRRARRSRSALLRAAIDLVTERGTAAIPITDFADAADVSRQVVYQQFGDRDTLLLEAAIDLARRELLPYIDDTHALDGRAQALTTASHLAGHRRFYRALLMSSCAFVLNKGLTGLLLPINREGIREIYSERLDPQMLDDVATYVTGGGTSLLNAWLVDGEDPLDPEEFTDRLMRMLSFLAWAHRTATGDTELGQ